MKQFSRCIFLLLAAFFISPLAGKHAQKYFKQQLKVAKSQTEPVDTNDNSGKQFFCELEETPENNFEEDGSSFKFTSSLKSDIIIFTTAAIGHVCSSPYFLNSGKLFLLFHSLKL